MNKEETLEIMKRYMRKAEEAGSYESSNYNIQVAIATGIKYMVEKR